jgi:hypothetical protein
MAKNKRAASRAKIVERYLRDRLRRRNPYANGLTFHATSNPRFISVSEMSHALRRELLLTK